MFLSELPIFLAQNPIFSWWNCHVSSLLRVTKKAPWTPGVVASYRRVKWGLAIPDAYVAEHWEPRGWIHLPMWGPPSDVCWFINPMKTIVIYHKPVREIGVMFTNLAIVWGPHFVHDCAIFGVHVGKYPCMEHLGMVGRMFHIGEWIRMGCD